MLHPTRLQAQSMIDSDMLRYDGNAVRLLTNGMISDTLETPLQSTTKNVTTDFCRPIVYELLENVVRPVKTVKQLETQAAQTFICLAGFKSSNKSL